MVVKKLVVLFFIIIFSIPVLSWILVSIFPDKYVTSLVFKGLLDFFSIFIPFPDGEGGLGTIAALIIGYGLFYLFLSIGLLIAKGRQTKVAFLPIIVLIVAYLASSYASVRQNMEYKQMLETKRALFSDLKFILIDFDSFEKSIIDREIPIKVTLSFENDPYLASDYLLDIGFRAKSQEMLQYIPNTPLTFSENPIVVSGTMRAEDYKQTGAISLAILEAKTGIMVFNQELPIN